YQTEIARLTGMDVSNASLYDGGTALYEACSLASSVSKKRNRIVVDRSVNPIYRRILKTYTSNLDIEIIETGNGIRADKEAIKRELNGETAGLIIQNPSFFGVIDDHSDLAEVCRSNKTLLIESVNPLSLSRLKTPAEMGADICIGEGQPFGLPLSFGGPFLGFIACSKKLARKLPGRISGRTLDRDGKDGFVLTLQAREQHIRREKATSNICTNQALCALRAHIYLTLTGKEGLKEVFTQSHIKAEYTKKHLSNIKGIEIPEDGPTFNEFRIELPMDAEAAANKMIKHGYSAGFPLGFYYPDFRNSLLIAVTEKRTAEEIDQFANTLKEIL
ncbi:MAG: aminomethyl-transferring glycine dehydrogenase subunit GcvPA, partial [Chitinivibrionales bacterium]